MAEFWEQDALAQPAEPATAPAAPRGDEFWKDDPPVAAPRPPDFSNPAEAEAVRQSTVGRVMSVLAAGWSGAKEGWGSSPLGMSDKDVQFMQEHGLFRTQRDEGVAGVFRAFNETLLYKGAQLLDGAIRAPNAIYHALGDAAMEAGVPRDIVAMPEAFFGSPHPMGIPETAAKPVEAMRQAEPALQEARNLGVVGDGRPPIAEGKPQDAAAAAIDPQPKAMAAGRTGDDVMQGPPGAAAEDPWRARFDQFVSKIEAPQDVQRLISEAADANNDFPAARQGEIPLSQVEALSEAAGVPSADLTDAQKSGMGRMLRNDDQVRVAMQMMLKVTDDVKEAARNVKADESPESLIKLQEAMMRRDIAVEQVVGLRSEWGRTGNVFQEFLRDVKDQEGLSQFLKDKGRSPGDLVDIAHMVDSLDRGQAARFLHNARTPNFWDKYVFYWVNSLISGPITHAKYVLANGAFGAYEAGVVTPIAGAIGAAREAVTGSADRVYMGETAARMWGLLAGTPDALRAAVRAAKENIQVPLPAQVAQAGKEAAATGIAPEIALARINPFTQTRQNPIGGTLGTIVGIPARGATGIHSFFNFLGYRAELEAQAYRAAAKEGLSPTSDQFWQRRQSLADNPSEEAMNAAVKNGYHLTFISEQGQVGKAVSKLANARFNLAGGGDWQPFKLLFPFTHIPGNILKASMEQTPLAFLDTEMRADLTGKNGPVARDTAYARIVAGSALSATVANWALNDNATGFGPTDPKERAIWLRTHEPYSIRLGNYWVSYNRFGPIGDLMGVISNLVEVGPKVKAGEYAAAAGQITKAMSHLVTDEVGMQGLSNIVEAMSDPDRNGARFVSSQLATNLPFSSAMRQAASFMDPHVREAKTFVDGLRNTIPFARQDLLPKRDWLGAPLANPGYHAIVRTRAANADPIDLEIQRLQIKPSPPQDRIGGVKLSPELYDQYQAIAGTATHMLLDKMVGMEGWYNLPPFVRETAIHKMIEAGRRQGAVTMQAAHPELILQGMQQRIDHITGKSPTARPKRAPEPSPALLQ